jgi:hypothetical protein
LNDGKTPFRPLIRSRLTLVALFVYLLYAIIAAFVPLLNNFGFEFFLLLCPIAALFSILGTVSSIFLWAPEKDEITRAESMIEQGVLALSTKAILFQMGLSGIPVAIHVITSLIGKTTCNWPLGMAWGALLLVVTVVYASMWGLLIATFLKTRRFALVVAAVLVIGGIFWSLYEMAAGPHCFAFNPFFGYFPGPIYDRVVPITAGLIAFRTSNLVTAIFLGCFLSITLKLSLRRGGRKEPRLTAAETSVGVVTLIALLAFSAYRVELGLVSSHDVIRQELSVSEETDHFIIYYPPDGPISEAIDLIAADHEFRFAQITSTLEIEFDRKIRSYIYRNDAQKKRLQGAGPTMYADVSNAAIHMSYRGFPHRVLKHELTHVIAAPWGIPYFGWSSKVGLTEGIATSIEGFRGDGTTHQWAAAMRKIGRLPDIESIMSAIGFWSRSGSRSYLTAGSFSLWLIETGGIDLYRQMYTWGRFEKVYGVELAKLKEDWLEFLDTVTLSDRMIQQARHKFLRKSLFEMRCAREVERLLDEGWKKFDRGLFTDAAAVFESAADCAESPKIDLARVAALVKAHRYDEARAIADGLIEKQGGIEPLDPNYAGKVSIKPTVRALGDLAALDWLEGKLEAAKAKYELILQANYSDDDTRYALCALAAIADPSLEPYLRIYLASELPGSHRAYYLQSATQKLEHPIPTYLLGRRMFRDGAFYAGAANFLASLQQAELPGALRVQALESAGIALFRQKRFTDAEAIFRVLLAESISDGRKLKTVEWIDRVLFTSVFLANRGN